MKVTSLANPIIKEVRYMKEVKRKKKKGFTLIELIVVIAILGILAAIAVPKLSGFTTSAKLKADYATAATIGHAAQAYLVNNPTVTDLDITTLQTANLLPSNMSTTTQSSGGSWTIEVSTNGDITVTDGKTILYPTPSTTP